MSDLTAPQPMLPPEPPRLGQWIVWAALASLMLHAGVLTLLLWQPLPDAAEAEQPAAVDVELVPPPEAASEQPSSEEPAEEPAPAEPAAEPPAAEEPSEEAPAEPETAPQTETTSEAESTPAAAPAEPAEVTAAEPPPEQAAAPASSAAEASAPDVPETASEGPTAAAPPASEAATSAEAEPPQGSVDEAKVAPIPLARPKVRGLTAPADAPDEGASAPSDDSDAVAEGMVTAAASAEPDVATLELGAQRSAEQFYLEAMLSSARLAPVREALKTLPPEKRLAQTCNIEALAQIGNSGEGFTPDVVMAEAYALSEMAGTRLVANGAIFRSGEKWFGVAFDCTLSDDLTRVTAFSYRLGADVTEAVLARLEESQPDR